ncbi:hypothetical protein QYM36_012990 [Artemia franciscana]|uniref:Uncharacterized protein n=1 Tax=Artemia franciscana TaxID=6661 RepID=A0AA88HF62_ARTSF|nr:hypothetical protein QYM36_012990 [Artemia franciscana]
MTAYVFKNAMKQGRCKVSMKNTRLDYSEHVPEAAPKVGGPPPKLSQWAAAENMSARRRGVRRRRSANE